MLSSFERGTISLIKSALSNTCAEITEDYDFNKAYELSVAQQIVPIIYYGALGVKGFDKLEISKKFLLATAKLTAYSANQLELIDAVFSSFNQNGIDHLKLKGTVLKKMYPYPEMRMMSDADILIKESQYAKIEKIMLDLGFEKAYESDHELAWRKNGFLIELHRRLMPSYTEDYHSYYGDGWDKLEKCGEEGFEYRMNQNDEFIYNFTHFARHYRDGGVGIKFMTDFYVFFEKHKELDMNYIEDELEKMELTRFWQNTKKLINVWFYGEEGDEVSDFITAKIFASDTYGTHLGKLEAEAARLSQGGGSKKVKKKKFWNAVFPNFTTMKILYPVLKRMPILLPFMWIWRIIDRLIFKRKRVKIETVSDEAIDRYNLELDYVGLPYGFKAKV